MNFFAEYGIGIYERLVEWCDALAAASICVRENLWITEQQIADLALLEKQTDAYHKLKPVYNRYKTSKGKGKFPRDFENEIIL